MSAIGAAGSTAADLTNKIVGGGLQATTDMAMKGVRAATEAKVNLHQHQTTMNAVATISGIGSKIDTVA